MDGHRASGQPVAHRIPLTGCLTIAPLRHKGLRGSPGPDNTEITQSDVHTADSTTVSVGRSIRDRAAAGNRPVIPHPVGVGAAQRLDGVSEMTGHGGDRGALGEHRGGAPVAQAVELVRPFVKAGADQRRTPHRRIEHEPLSCLTESTPEHEPAPLPLDGRGLRQAVGRRAGSTLILLARDRRPGIGHRSSECSLRRGIPPRQVVRGSRRRGVPPPPSTVRRAPEPRFTSSTLTGETRWGSG